MSISGGAEERAGAVFAALADPTRRHVLAMVGEKGPLSASELADGLPVSRQAIVKHLDALRSAGLVDSARNGRAVLFTLKTDALDDAAAWMADAGRRWDRRLAALSRRASERGPSRGG